MCKICTVEGCDKKIQAKNNKSGIKEVYWSNSKNKWCAQVTINNKTKLIGRFDNYNDAIQARLKAEKEYYGEFANASC